MGKKADWERCNICHVPERKSWLTTTMRVYYGTGKKKPAIMKQKCWKACMTFIQICTHFLLTRKICSETFPLGLSFIMCCRESKPFIWVPMKLEHRKVNYCKDGSKPAFKPVAAKQRGLWPHKGVLHTGSVTQVRAPNSILAPGRVRAYNSWGNETVFW